MRVSWRRAVLPAVLLLGLTGVASAQQRQQTPRQPAPVIPWGGPPFTWWRDASFQTELQLTTDQSNQIDMVFRSARPQLRAKFEALNAQENELSRLVETDADEATILRQSKYVESIRAELNTARTLMVWHMRQILTPDQRAKMKALSEQWNRDHQQPLVRNGRSRGAPRPN